MQLIPAIDLLDGNCVRLEKGDFSQATVYESDPILMATQFANQGAKALHIVDLTGAKAGSLKQIEIIKQIANLTELSIQVGGGVRNEQNIQTLLDAGVSRVVIGSLAVQDPKLVASWLTKFGEEVIVLAIDVKKNQENDYQIAYKAWAEFSKLKLFQLIEYYMQNNLRHLLCTDISKDGMLSGPNFPLYQSITKKFPTIKLQASGGISQESDLIMLNKIPVASAILGKSLYEQRIQLKDAIKVLDLC